MQVARQRGHTITDHFLSSAL
ncbi:hypothetical protein M3J09_007542 [Ascochyta lentis]